ncbi:phage tail tube protein [Actinopolyspora halophila]|uniref:phage tail tube protein n=1 Tax=Actinopolyspora halophila TaxID=1850 RepID=UPI00035C31A9|nr:hypothetical protein [Actinopolyspora halophila]
MGKQIDARGWVFEIDDGTGTDTWLPIGELTEFTLNSSENEETANTTTFESQGMYSSQAMQRGATLELTGMWAYDDTGTSRDPGQQRVEDMAGKVSDASLTQLRFRHDSQSEWKIWTCWLTLGEQGGGTNAKTSWACTAHRSGPSTTQAVA